MGIHDSAVCNAQLIQAHGPPLQLTTVTAREGHMIEAGAKFVESVTCGLGVRMQAEQLPSIECEYCVVKAPRLFVLVENGLGGRDQGFGWARMLQPGEYGLLSARFVAAFSAGLR